MTINHFRHIEKFTIIKDSCTGAAAGQGDWSKVLSFNLADIKYEVSGAKVGHNGTTKKLSAADQFMMASLQPACHTKKFSNDYVLSVQLSYDGCVCCIDLPDA